jgi:cysteine desulfurase family protein (TIGR01976 family)
MIDLDFVRRQFPAFATASLDGQSFFENAGGSYMCQPVIDRFNRYFVQRKVQPYYAFAASQEAGAEMDLAPVRFARYLNVDADEVLFGPSTSQNTYVLARACLERLAPGEAIIVSAQEHEANSGVWRKLADYGIDIRIWPIDPRDGRLHLADLLSLLDNKVRLVAVTHCSNLVGEINPVRAIADATHQAGGLLLVDGVSYCPHGFPDVDALGADIYLFSTYKTYGPHQGVMVIRHAARALLAPQAHFFNHDNPMKWMVPAGPDHAQMAVANGVIDYFDALDAHHGGQDDKDRPSRVAALFKNAETPHIKTLLDYIGSRNDVRLIGPADPARRTATISFVVPHLSAGAIGQRLADRGIMAGAGHYYAARLFSQMGLDPAAGAVRLSFVHYTSSADMTKLITAIDEIL